MNSWEGRVSGLPPCSGAKHVTPPVSARHGLVIGISRQRLVQQRIHPPLCQLDQVHDAQRDVAVGARLAVGIFVGGSSSGLQDGVDGDKGGFRAVRLRWEPWWGNRALRLNVGAGSLP